MMESSEYKKKKEAQERREISEEFWGITGAALEC